MTSYAHTTISLEEILKGKNVGTLLGGEKAIYQSNFV
jgi:hypothetical protein